MVLFPNSDCPAFGVSSSWHTIFEKSAEEQLRARQADRRMNSRAKKLEAQREREVRALLNLPQNRRCLTCSTKTRPTYVCTTYGTFICTTCSGVHRGFGYRVKSVSYSTFTAEEVESLKRLGNGVAREKWFPPGTRVPEEG